MITGRFGELHDIEATATRNLHHNVTAIRVAQTLGARQLVGMVPVTDELIADSALFATALNAVFDKTFRPWRYPDPNPMPQFVLFPRLDAVWRRLRRKGRK